MIRTFVGVCAIAALLTTSNSPVAAQRATVASVSSTHSRSIVYQYPLANAVQVVRESGIGLRFDSPLPTEGASVSFRVTGSVSGEHTGKTVITSDRTMAIFTPSEPYAYGERVMVAASIARSSGTFEHSFSFTTTTVTPEKARQAHASLLKEFEAILTQSRTAEPSRSAASLVDTFTNLPPLSTSVDLSPSKGDIFLSNFGFQAVQNGDYLLVLDEHGAIQKQKFANGSKVIDFRKQANGMWTYYDDLGFKFYGVDTNFAIVDSFMVSPGYQPDGHELILLPNGGYMLIAIEETEEDMSKVYATGKKNAILETNLIEEFDRSRNLIFQWRGIDHMDLLDASHENLSKTTIDAQHANAIEIDPDGNLLLSSRHWSEITKIDRQTGDIMWRMGGAHNQFTFVDDTEGFSYQHDCRILPNGHMTLFDNGNYHADPESRALEYVIDTAARTVRKVWEFRHTPAVFSMAMGNVQRLANGSTLICWGASTTNVTEVKPDGTVDFDLSLGGNNYTYRAFKYLTGPAAVQAPAHSASSTQAYPNPASSRAQVDFSLPIREHVRATLVDVTGRIVKQIFEGELPEGGHSIELDLTGLAPGTYHCLFAAPTGVTSARVMIVH